jgi:hypothetical protein
MSSVLAPLFRIEERALSIGLWLKRSSQSEISVPKPHGFREAFLWCETIPLQPFAPFGEFFHALYFNNTKARQNRRESGDVPEWR